MFDVNVTFTGTNRVRNQLRAAASFYKKDGDKVIERHVKNEAKRLRRKPYPARLPNQKYQRTMELGKHFRAQKVKTGTWRIINRVRNKYGRAYAVWVVKKGMQNIKYHLGRWWTVEDETQKNAPELTKNLATTFEELMNSQ